MNKESILSVINQKLADKNQYLQNLIDETRASNNDTKSSMGDKYETGREMLQQEINNLQVQLNEVLKQQNFVKTILIKSCDKVEKGAIVTTDKGQFFISVSVGEIKIDKEKLICISLESPLAIAMMDKKVDEKFSINNIHQTIKSIH